LSGNGLRVAEATRSPKVLDTGPSAATRHGRPVLPPLRLAIAAVLLVEMILRVVVGVQASARSVDQLNGMQAQRDARLQTERYTCLEAAMRTRIPIGSLVFNESTDDHGRQRIAEELTPGYRFVEAPVPGSYKVRFIEPGPCFDLGVDVRRVASR
jgi:hypothetical protein